MEKFRADVLPCKQKGGIVSGGAPFVCLAPCLSGLRLVPNLMLKIWD